MIQQRLVSNAADAPQRRIGSMPAIRSKNRCQTPLFVGRPDGAVEPYRCAMTLAPFFFKLRNNLAEILTYINY